MRDLFPGYYQPKEEDFSLLWESCTFILDSNVILNLYRYSEETRNDFFNLFHKIEKRLWIPHQVALEYQENRIAVIESEEKKFESLKSALNNIKYQLQNQFHQFPSFDSKDLINQVDELFCSFVEKLEPLKSQQLKTGMHDHIRSTIDGLLKDKIGISPTKQELDGIYKEGEERYKIKYPPGFKDNDKAKEPPHLCNGIAFKKEYGDLILWKQILKEVQSQNLKYIIFITDDDKEDWWRKQKGKTIGARPELVEEICKAGASIFHMYTPELFLKYAKKYISVDIKQESIKQAGDIADLKVALKDFFVSSESKNSFSEITETRIKIAFLKWLRNQYPSDEIFVEKDRSSVVNFIRISSEDGDRTGYKLKYVHSPKIFNQIEKIVEQIKFFVVRRNLQDVCFVLVVENDSLGSSIEGLHRINNLLLKNNIQNFSGIIGRIDWDEDSIEEEVAKPIFRLLYKTLIN